MILAHGFGGSVDRFDAIARRLARAGYVVAAPAFPLTNESAPGGHLTGLGDVVEQPRDLSFVLDRLEELSTDPGDPVGSRLDPALVAAVGHSLGAATVLPWTRLECCRDPRVLAAVLVAPAAPIVERVFGEAPEHAGPPTLIVQGSADPVVRPQIARDLFDAIEPDRALLEIAGANHTSAIEAQGEPSADLDVAARAIVAFLDRFLGDAPGLEATLSELGAEGHVVRWDFSSPAPGGTTSHRAQASARSAAARHFLY